MGEMVIRFCDTENSDMPDFRRRDLEASQMPHKTIVDDDASSYHLKIREKTLRLSARRLFAQNRATSVSYNVGIRQ